ncbi:MAG: DUF2156 domain-containing protein [Peptococcaceae bacterium]
MIEFQDVTLKDKAMIDQYFRKGQYRNSECTFTNLFIWRDCYAVQWAVVDGLLVIKPGQSDENWILPPYGDYGACDLKAVLLQLKDYFAAQGKPLVLRAVTEEFAEVLEKTCPGMFQLEEERDLEDYLYLGDDLRELKGRRYHSKRNHLSNFRKNYPDYVYEPMTAAMREEIWDYINLWCRQKECSGKFSDGLICEKKAIREALDYFDQLDYTGAVIRINGQIEAFTMGEKINDDTVVIHVEKANGLINGLYGAINQEFLLHAWPDVKYVNREEDTGDEGLRKAKQSYYPLELVKKYKGVYRG